MTPGGRGGWPLTLLPWPLPGAQVQTPAPPLPSCFTSKSPQGSGSKTPTHAAIKYPLLRPETTGFYCLSVLGPDVPTQDVAGPRSLQRLQGESFPGIPRPLACGHIRAASASTDRGLSLRLRTSHIVFALCVSAPAGVQQDVRSLGFLVFSSRSH